MALVLCCTAVIRVWVVVCARAHATRQQTIASLGRAHLSMIACGAMAQTCAAQTAL